MMKGPKYLVSVKLIDLLCTHYNCISAFVKRRQQSIQRWVDTWKYSFQGAIWGHKIIIISLCL
ncbi:BnaC05g04610D [Brassica napus]|uniref:BnaC05g04610D protein n=1 Tax=Brassica napus TaxID=3708 RepID=A0A078FDQ7_BRANA|nr:BnaC05g04610D [Brassica napus]